MKLSCSAYQAGSCSYAQKIMGGHGHVQNYGATGSTGTNPTGESTHGLIMPSWKVEEIEGKGSPNDNSESITEESRASGTQKAEEASRHTSISSHSDGPPGHSDSTGKTHDSSRSPSESPAHRIGLETRSRSKSVGEQQWTNLRAVMAWYARLRKIKRSRSNQRWMKLRTTVQLSGAITSTVQKKATLKREDSFLKRFSTRQQVPETQETFEIGEDDGSGGGGGSQSKYRRKKKRSLPWSVVNPDGNFYFYWLFLLTVCVLYNLWTLIVRESFPELQSDYHVFWISADALTDLVIFLDLAVQFRTGYLEQGLMVYKTRKLASHYAGSKHFWFDVSSLTPTDLLQLYFGTHPMFRIPRFLKTYRMYNYYYMVESRTVYPNVWRVVNLIHILLLLAHWFGCFYYLLSEAEGFEGPWVYPHPGNNTEYAPLLRKYLGSLYWSTLTLTTIGDLPTPYSNWQYLFTIVSYLIGVFIFATIVGQVGNVITNRNANRLEFERLLDGAKMYMRHHKVPRDMQRRVLRWYDYSWSRGRIQGGGDINTALGLLPDKLKTELALHVNLSVLKKVTIFQECQPEFLHDLVLKMKAYIFTPGDLICRKGEVAREMFIIADGILEVISETGRVLTTMQAGDFFGEIGILNLDGLNKRTADVRSVGYSELFSLSREDVLAAMKDYPEAQNILQTLGTKRLLEARKANAPVKKVEKKTPLTLLGQSFAKGPEEIGLNGDTTGKRIVEKLRSDVKGLRNAIRKSRKSNSSKEDSSEPESTTKDSGKYESGGRRKESTASVYAGTTSIVGSMIPASAAGRGVLKRMHNVVLSDEVEKVGIGGDTSMSNLSPTILPKRVQMVLPSGDDPHRSREVIGAGLPLIQRLRLLKQKEDKEKLVVAKVEEETPSGTSVEKELHILIPPEREPEKSFFQTKVSVEPPPPAPKGAEKKTWRGSPESSQSSLKSPQPLVKVAPPEPPLDQPPRQDFRATSSESNTSEINEPTEVKIDEADGSGITRPSALRFQKKDPRNYGSVDDLSPEFSRLPFIKKLQILNERQKIAEIVSNKTGPVGLLTRSTSEGSSEIPHSLPPESENLHSVVLGRRTQSSSEPYGQAQAGPGPSPSRRRQVPVPFQLPLPSPSSSSSSSTEGGGQGSSGAVDDEPVRIPAPTPADRAAVGGGDDGAPLSPQASPPYSPECNETPERRHLKSILKTLAKSTEKGGGGEPAAEVAVEVSKVNLEDSKLLKEPTLEGYAARHRKFAKNVTFQRQAVRVLSPGESPPVHPEVEGAEIQKVEPPENLRISLPLDLMMGLKKRVDLGDEPMDFPLVSGFTGDPEEVMSGVFLGIKNILQSRMEEFQIRFQDRFTRLEKEVRQRDEIISLLQRRIQELEDKDLLTSANHLSAVRSVGNGRPFENHHDGDSYDEDEDEELEDGEAGRGKVLRRRNHPPPSSFLFSRGDSIDTVIDNTEVYEDDDEVFTREESTRSSTLNQLNNSQWTVAERESIEMSEFRGPEVQLWQLEFHREAMPVQPPPGPKPPDSVTLDMGNTSTEYESTSSSEEEQKQRGVKVWTTSAGSTMSTSGHRQLQEVPIPLEDSDKSEDEREGRENEDGRVGHVALESSDSDHEAEEEDEFDHQNWEVQMLAKELRKREEAERRISENAELDDLVVGEMIELDTEIQEMRYVVNSGQLSPTDLDMLESMLESRTERVQAIFKAYSVDDAGGRPLPGSSSNQTLSKPVGRSIGDFRPRTSVQYTHAPYPNFEHRRQWSHEGRGEKRPGESSAPGLNQRKKPNVRRQSSLCETGFPSKISSSYSGSKRRESAGSLGLFKPASAVSGGSGTSVAPPPGRSFLSRFNFMRSLSRTFLFPESSETPARKKGEDFPEEFPKEENPPQLGGTFGQETRKSSSPVGILPLLSSTLSSALSSSVRSDPGPSSSPQDSHPPIFTIPAVSIPQDSFMMDHPLSSPPNDRETPPPLHHRQTGESQPLLKK